MRSALRRLSDRLSYFLPSAVLSGCAAHGGIVALGSNLFPATVMNWFWYAYQLPSLDSRTPRWSAGQKD